MTEHQYERLVYLVTMAHREYHKRPDCPRATCEICRELDALQVRVTPLEPSPKETSA